MIAEIARAKKRRGGHCWRARRTSLKFIARSIVVVARFDRRANVADASMKLGTSRWALDPVRVVASPVRARSSRGARLAT
jgi:hypothetical protein